MKTLTKIQKDKLQKSKAMKLKILNNDDKVKKHEL